MKRLAIAVLAIALSSCADVKPGHDLYAAQRAMPPDRGMDCLNFELVDEACTRDWYKCQSGADGGASCRAMWKSCCRLPGQGSRSRIGRSEPVDN